MSRDVGAPKPFAHYDGRNYPTFSVTDGYARWAPTSGGSSYVEQTFSPTVNVSGENSGDGHVVVTWDHVMPQ